jgi:hypothetical protein
VVFIPQGDGGAGHNRDRVAELTGGELMGHVMASLWREVYLALIVYK